MSLLRATAFLTLLALTSCGRDAVKTLTAPSQQAAEVVSAARARIGVTKHYDAAYIGLDYPGGDVANDRGVCIDVVIRSLRAVGIDLQKEVHEDMTANFESYPKRWGLKKPDRNIDHRRVPNVAHYLKQKGFSLPVSKNPANYQPGDLVACTVRGGRPHIMIVSDRAKADGTPMIIHNIGRGTREENKLFNYPITGHFRLWVE